MAEIKNLIINGKTYAIADTDAINETQANAIALSVAGDMLVRSAVMFSGSQSLSADQKSRARANIGAADSDTVDSLDSTLLQKTDPCVLTKESVFYPGRIGSNGEFIELPETNIRRVSDFIELEKGITYKCDYEGIYDNGDVQTYPAVIAMYNSDQSFSRTLTLPDGLTKIGLENDEKYLRLQYAAVQLNILRVYPADIGHEIQVSLNPNLAVPQVKQVEREVDKIKEKGLLGDLVQEESPCVLTKDSVFYPGRIDSATGEIIAVSATDTRRVSDFIALEKCVTYKCDYEAILNGVTHTRLAVIAYYNGDKSFSRVASVNDHNMENMLLGSDEKYLRIQYSADQVNTLRIYPKYTGYESQTVLNPDLKVPQAEKVKEKINAGGLGYIHARRPVIAFILDGEYDRNATMEEIFSRHNMRIGFAPQYTTNFTNNPVATYLAWQEKGHEILAHGSYILREGNYTDEQIAEYIKASYTTLKGYGFDVYGFIGSSGKVDEKYVPLIKKYYDYAATENNGITTSEPCLYFGVNGPYNLYRYSVQRTPLEQCKAAVDRALETGGLVLFMGHANSADIDYLTDENVEALLTYIEQAGATVKTPYEAIRDYYSIRYEDIIN